MGRLGRFLFLARAHRIAILIPLQYMPIGGSSGSSLESMTYAMSCTILTNVRILKVLAYWKDRIINKIGEQAGLKMKKTESKH